MSKTAANHAALARSLGVSRQSVWNWRRDARISPHLPGKGPNGHDVEAWRRVLSAGITATSGRNGELWIALACLECDAGNLDPAKDALHKAIDTDGNLRLRALDEPALAPLWTV